MNFSSANQRGHGRGRDKFNRDCYPKLTHAVTNPAIEPGALKNMYMYTPFVMSVSVLKINIQCHMQSLDSDKTPHTCTTRNKEEVYQYKVTVCDVLSTV